MVTKLKKITQDELNELVSLHQDWVMSNHSKGIQLNLQGCDLKDLNLDTAILDYSTIQHCNLSGVSAKATRFYEADIQGTDFTNTDLKAAGFSGASVQGAMFDNNILGSWSLRGTVWLVTDIPWFLYHDDYLLWASTVKILDKQL